MDFYVLLVRISRFYKNLFKRRIKRNFSNYKTKYLLKKGCKMNELKKERKMNELKKEIVFEYENFKTLVTSMQQIQKNIHDRYDNLVELLMKDKEELSKHHIQIVAFDHEWTAVYKYEDKHYESNSRVSAEAAVRFLIHQIPISILAKDILLEKKER
jgi:hypothetical protein